VRWTYQQPFIRPKCFVQVLFSFLSFFLERFFLGFPSRQDLVACFSCFSQLFDCSSHYQECYFDFLELGIASAPFFSPSFFPDVAVTFFFIFFLSNSPGCVLMALYGGMPAF